MKSSRRICRSLRMVAIARKGEVGWGMNLTSSEEIWRKVWAFEALLDCVRAELITRSYPSDSNSEKQQEVMAFYIEVYQDCQDG